MRSGQKEGEQGSCERGRGGRGGTFFRQPRRLGRHRKPHVRSDGGACMAYRRAEASTTADSALVHKKSEWKVEVGSNNFRCGVRPCRASSSQKTEEYCPPMNS